MNVGPLIESTSLEAIISEMGRLAIQVGEKLNHFLQVHPHHSLSSCIEFAKLKPLWISEFYWPGKLNLVALGS